jgi:hypothetical protein
MTTPCPVCGTANTQLAVVCTSCGAWLQTKVDNLDLFRTGWSVLERPSRAFHEIAIARHKNYVFLLSAFIGISYVFGIFWAFKAGEFSPSLINLLFAGITVGPFFGIAAVPLFALLVKLQSRPAGKPLTFLNCLAVVAYGQIPLALTAVLFLPVELLTFGLYFFTRNPSPYTLRPGSYVVLIGLDALFTLWALVLTVVGLKVAMGTGWIRPAAIVVIASGVMAGLVALAVSMFV